MQGSVTPEDTYDIDSCAQRGHFILRSMINSTNIFEPLLLTTSKAPLALPGVWIQVHTRLAC